MRSAAILLFVAACSVERSPPDLATGVHPTGWVDPQSPAFHAEWLKTNGFALDRCQACHGADYAGGGAGVSCAQAGCHQQAPTACTTCHGSNGTPRPATGAHWAHARFCDTCHQVPTTSQVQAHASGDRASIVRFGGLAKSGGAQPTYDTSAQQCANTYCHGALSPAWNGAAAIGCDGCHAAPPASHARWSRLAPTTESCATCHPKPDDPRHVNGVVDVTVTACTTCHGADDHASPPVALDGSTDPTSRGVGAHERHLNAALPDRIGKPAVCNDCHVVPATVRDPGHLDAPETQVRFPFGGAYDRTQQTCTVWCHFDRAPGPQWTNASGSARVCGACHDFPPRVTRAGTPHPTVAGDVSVCRDCHVFDPSTHVNGVVDFVTP